MEYWAKGPKQNPLLLTIFVASEALVAIFDIGVS
jgi:hypothetical protein